MKLIQSVSNVLLLLVIVGCASHNGSSTSADNLSNPAKIPTIYWQSDAYSQVDVPKVRDIFYLNDEKKQDFLSFYYDPLNQNITGNQRLAEYLEQFLSGFSYKGDTYNANLAAINQEGNCLSLAILTKAYASLVGLKVEYRKVNTAPVYSRKNGILALSSHVQTHIINTSTKNSEHSSFFFSKTIIDYFPSSRGMLSDVVSEEDFIAMYYQNLAAKALMTNEFGLAYSLLAEAMELSPNNVETLNTLAVFHRKVGESDVAESIYKYLLEYTKASVSVLSNYVTLLKGSKRSAEAAIYEAKYLQIEDDNPYRWYDLANEAYAEKNYRKALALYRKSADMAPYLDENFFGRAKSYFKIGALNKADKALRRALELADTRSDEKLYSAKLLSLQSNH